MNVTGNNLWDELGGNLGFSQSFLHVLVTCQGSRRGENN